ncbi:FK506-binding nuclear protein-like [Asparagus officinalis]|uniref:FK506-binding nuclear protein-like n=1 Tax=Asparagus officinalis TaxID=4686 RepID=UPI00098E3A04|nr:FK506-binding nuclear protein-like [Asparagus officinalis]
MQKEIDEVEEKNQEVAQEEKEVKKEEGQEVDVEKDKEKKEGKEEDDDELDFDPSAVDRCSFHMAIGTHQVEVFEAIGGAIIRKIDDIREGNLKLLNSNDIRIHLMKSGFDEKYKYWNWHGEGITEDEDPNVRVGTSGGQRIDDTETMLNDIFPRPREFEGDDNVEDDIGDKSEDDIDVEAEEVGDDGSAENIDDMHSSAEIERILKLLEDTYANLSGYSTKDEEEDEEAL